MTQVTCRLTAKNRDPLRNPMLCNRVWATFTFFTHLLTCLLFKKIVATGTVDRLLVLHEKASKAKKAKKQKAKLTRVTVGGVAQW